MKTLFSAHEGEEENCSKYREIEVAQHTTEYQRGKFLKISERRADNFSEADYHGELFRLLLRFRVDEISLLRGIIYDAREGNFFCFDKTTSHREKPTKNVSEIHFTLRNYGI
jgi:hypothetical protein